MSRPDNFVNVNTYTINGKNNQIENFDDDQDDDNDENTYRNYPTNENLQFDPRQMARGFNYYPQDAQQQQQDEDYDQETIPIDNPAYYRQAPQPDQYQQMQQPRQQPPQFNPQSQPPQSQPPQFNPDERDNETSNRENANYEFYFQTKIRNSGFWGKVRLRRGTWMVIVGLFALCISLAIISVFWAFWYHPAVNTPCRVLGITLLVWSCFTVLLGLLSNFLMMNDPSYKFFVGSPARWSFWMLLASIIALTIASDLITVYYTYWHTRFVNTPMIVVSLILYFFGSIGFFMGFYMTVKAMRVDRRRFKYGPDAVGEKKGKHKNDDVDEEVDEDDEESDDEGEGQNDSGMEKLYEARNAADLSYTTESEGKKKDFRKKIVQIKPRNFVNQTSYSAGNPANTSQMQPNFNSSMNQQ